VSFPAGAGVQPQVINPEQQAQIDRENWLRSSLQRAGIDSTGMDFDQMAQMANQGRMMVPGLGSFMPGGDFAAGGQMVGGGVQPAAGQAQPVTAEGRNPLFPFISGRKLPVRQTLGQMQSGSQAIPLISGLASYSGQEPSSFWGEFGKFLPKGGRNPLTRFA